MEDLQPKPLRKEIKLPEDILNKHIYIYRGYTGDVTDDGYPGEPDDFSFWAPTPDLPFAAMRGHEGNESGLFRAKVKVRDLLETGIVSSEIFDFCLHHDHLISGAIVDIEELSGDDFERIKKAWDGYIIGTLDEDLGENEVPRDEHQFKQWLLKNKDNPAVFPDSAN